MVNPDFNNAEISRLSDFAFGLPSDAPRRVELVDSTSRPETGTKRPGKTSVGELLVALLILSAALLSCFGVNSELIMHRFPQLAVVLHLAPAPEPVALLSAADAQIKVWADMRTALYYCPGSAFFGSTKSGHFMSQAEAQLGNFEPAERRACTAGPRSKTPTRMAKR